MFLSLDLEEIISSVHDLLIPGIATVLAPLHALCSSVPTQKSALLWTKTQDTAFIDAKLSLCNAIQLRHPDPSDAITLTTDASLVVVGAVLAGSDGAPIASFSKKLTDAEVKYSAFDRELLAVFLSVKHFRHMLELSLIHI